MTTLQRAPGTALHRQLFIVLRDQIARGAYAAGDTLPREEDLCARFGVSRITVRRAVSDLEQLGLVAKQPGRGTFVTAPAQPARPAATLNFIGTLSQQARDTDVTVLQVELAPPPPAIALQLGLARGERAVHASRLRSMHSGTPVMATEAWVPEAVGRHVTAAQLKKHALFEILLAEGVKFGSVIQEVTATAADPQLAGLLRTDVGAPLLRVTRLLHDPQRRPVLHLTIHVSPNSSRLLMEVTSDAINTLSAGQIVHDIEAGDGAGPVRGSRGGRGP